MKVVLLHDWLTGFRGGERVLEVFCEMFPQAPLYTLIHTPGSTSSIIEKRPVHATFLNNIPGISKNYRKYLPLFPMAAQSIKIPADTDLILSSSHCVIKGVKVPERAKHLCYIHSPMRYLYDQFDQYFGPTAPIYQRLGMKAFKRYLMDFDWQSNQGVDHFLANSKFVSQRISKYYSRSSDVVHPFVELNDFPIDEFQVEDRQKFYLMVTAFAPNKNVELAVRTFNKLKRPLKIIGSGQQESFLKKLALPHIEFLGNLQRQEVVEHFRQARAFVFPGVEDFGITPLESLASGTPVIAFKAGGVLETLTDDCSTFFTEQSEEGLSEAVFSFEQSTFDRRLLRQRAEEFSREQFKSNIEKQISKLMDQNG